MVDLTCRGCASFFSVEFRSMKFMKFMVGLVLFFFGAEGVDLVTSSICSMHI